MLGYEKLFGRSGTSLIVELPFFVDYNGRMVRFWKLGYGKLLGRSKTS